MLLEAHVMLDSISCICANLFLALSETHHYCVANISFFNFHISWHDIFQHFLNMHGYAYFNTLYY